MPKGENLYDAHLWGDSTKKDSVVKDSITVRDVSALADSAIGVQIREVPRDIRIYSRASPTKYHYVKAASDKKQKKAEKKRKKELKKEKKESSDQ